MKRARSPIAQTSCPICLETPTGAMMCYACGVCMCGNCSHELLHRDSVVVHNEHDVEFNPMASCPQCRVKLTPLLLTPMPSSMTHCLHCGMTNVDGRHFATCESAPHFRCPLCDTEESTPTRFTRTRLRQHLPHHCARALRGHRSNLLTTIKLLVQFVEGIELLTFGWGNTALVVTPSLYLEGLCFDDFILNANCFYV